METRDKIIVLADQMIENNYKLIKNLSMLTPSEQLHYYPKVMKSIADTQKQLNQLIYASGINELPGVAVSPI